MSVKICFTHNLPRVIWSRLIITATTNIVNININTLEKQSKSREGMRLGKSPEMKKLENNPARPGQTLR